MLMAAGGANSGGSAVLPDYRYIQFILESINGDAASILAIQEIEIATSFGGADITTPSSPTKQQSCYDSRFCFTKAFDGNLTTTTNAYAPIANAFPQWAWVDLLAPEKIVEIRMQAQYGYPARGPKDFVIQGTNDDPNGSPIWTDIQQYAGVTGWTDGVWKTFNLIDGTWV